MPAIGITGGIATGKSTFCDCLRALLPDAKFFNADLAAKELVDLDPEVRKEIETQFGPGIYSSAGDLNRARLRAIVFASADQRGALEKILHPRIRRRWSAEAQTHRNSPNFFFADIPLLYETGGETLCDRVVVVACAPDLQRARLLQRGSLQPDEAEKIIKSQMTLTEKIARADHVVWNDGDRAVLAEQTKLLVDLWQTESWTKR
ncbi:MAG: dephospho-CoA kinase [Spartobacteria bacterium]